MQEVMKMIIEDFAKYNGKSGLVVLFLLSLIYLWIVEKDKRIRTILVYLVTALCVVFVCPVYAMIAKKIDSEIYYRVLWTIPVGVLFCYSVMKLVSNLKKPVSKVVVFLLAVLVIVINGDFVYTKTMHFKATNKYHMPEVVMHVSDALAMDQYTPHVAMPAELLPFVKQYSAEFYTAYGRNILEPQWSFSNALYDAMEAPQYDLELVAKRAREENCFYVLLNSSKPQIGSIEEQNYVYLDFIDGYYLYMDAQIYNELQELNLLSEEEYNRFESAIHR